MSKRGLRFALLLAVCLCVGWPGDKNVASAASDQDATSSQGSLTNFIPEHAFGALVARPAALIKDSEMEILGDVPFLGQYPVPPSAMESVVFLFAPEPINKGMPWAFGLRFNRDVPRTTVRRWLAPDATQNFDEDVEIYSQPDGRGWNVAFPEPNVVLASRDGMLLWKMIEARDDDDSTSPLHQHLDNALQESSVAAAIDVGRLRMLAMPVYEPAAEPGTLAGALSSLPHEMSLAVVQAKFGKRSNKLHVTFTRRPGVADSDDLGEWAKSCATGAERLLDFVCDWQKRELPAQRHAVIDGMACGATGFVRGMVVDGTSPTPTLSTDQLAPISRLIYHAGEVMGLQVEIARRKAHEMQDANNMRQILLSWLEHENEFERFPVNITDEEGKPLLSWRVRVLPLLGRTELFKRFRFDEPWDSPANKKLVAEMPPVFSSLGSRNVPGLTHFQAAAGPGTVLGDRAVRRQIVDGTTKTLTLVQAAKPVVWTKPEDFTVPNQNVYQSLQKSLRGETLCGFLDGHVERLPKLADATYGKIFRYDDRQILDDEELRPSDDEPPKPAEPLAVAEIKQCLNDADPSDPVAFRRDLKRVLDACLKHELFDEPGLVAENVLAKLQPWVQSEDEFVRYWASQMYFGLPVGDSLDWQLAAWLLNDRTAEVRWDVMQSLERSDDPRAVPVLLQAKRVDEFLSDHLVLNLEDAGISVADELAPLLANSDQVVRERACRLIGITGEPKHVESLRPLLADKDLRRAAEQAIQRIEERADLAATAPDPFEEEQQRQEMLQQRSSLIQSVNQAMEKNDLPTAIAAAKKMFAIEEQLFGKTDDKVFSTLGWLANQSAAAGDRESARATLEQLRARKSERYGKDHWQTTNATWDLKVFDQDSKLTEDQRKQLAEAAQVAKTGVQHFQAKEYQDAVESIVEAAKIRRAVFGIEHPRTINTIRILRAVFVEMKDYARARRVGSELVTANEAAFGADHPVTINDRVESGFIHHLGGDAEQAVTILSALAEPLERHGKLDQAGTVRQRLGRSAAERGAASEAIVHLSEALRLFDQGGKAREAAVAAKELADVYEKMGNTPAALTALFDSIWRTSSLENVAVQQFLNYGALAGIYEKLRQHHLELVVRKTNVDSVAQALRQGTAIPALGILSLTSFAETYLALGDFEMAEFALANVGQLAEKTNRPSLLIDTFAGLAQIDEHRGDLDLAEKRLKRAVQLVEGQDPTQPEVVVPHLQNLAGFYLAQGKADAALPLAERAKDLSASVNAKQHLRSLAMLARAHHALGDTEKARKAAETGRQQLAGPAEKPFVDDGLLLEHSRLNMLLGDHKKSLEFCRHALAVCETRAGKESLRYAEILAHAAQLHVLVGKSARVAQPAAEAFATTRRFVNSSAYIMSPRQHIAMDRVMRRSLDAYLSVGLDGDVAAENVFQHVFQWKGFALDRHRVVREMSAQMRAAPFLQQLTLDAGVAGAPLAYLDLQDPSSLGDFFNSLPGDSLFIDYFVYGRIHPGDDAAAVPSLMASVVRSDGNVQVHDLGPMAPVETAIVVWRESFGTSDDARRAGVQLRSLIWDPLLAGAENVQTILISPDGALGQLPFHALPAEDDRRFVIEDYRIAIVPIPQLLPRTLEQLPAVAGANSLLLVGGVDYEAAAAQGESVGQLLRSNSTWFVRGGNTFPSLPETADEIAAVRRVVLAADGFDERKIETLTGAAATEAAIRSRATRFNMLHLATHGFFAGPLKHAADAPAVDSVTSGSGTHDTRSIVQVHSPGVLSGLVAAGANASRHDGSDDEILTAEEIATLDLDGVNLAVLSACDPDRGGGVGGERLIGLQRAFQVAGARSTIASLWKVDDRATRVFLERFYRNLLSEKMTKLDALREAQLWMLNHPQDVLSANEAENAAGPNESQRLSPQFWAAFSLSGDWR